jgi:cytochrome c553
MGRLVSRVLSPRPGPSELARAIAEARAAGLTDADIDAELAAHKAAQATAGKALVKEFREFRRGRSLGGLDPKALIREGLR